MRRPWCPIQPHRRAKRYVAPLRSPRYPCIHPTGDSRGSLPAADGGAVAPVDPVDVTWHCARSQRPWLAPNLLRRPFFDLTPPDSDACVAASNCRGRRTSRSDERASRPPSVTTAPAGIRNAEGASKPPPRTSPMGCRAACPIPPESESYASSLPQLSTGRPQAIHFPQCGGSRLRPGDIWVWPP